VFHVCSCTIKLSSIYPYTRVAPMELWDLLIAKAINRSLLRSSEHSFLILFLRLMPTGLGKFKQLLFIYFSISEIIYESSLFESNVVHYFQNINP